MVTQSSILNGMKWVGLIQYVLGGISKVISRGTQDASDPKTNNSENHMHEARSGAVRYEPYDAQGSKFNSTKLRSSSKHKDGEENYIKLGIVSDKQMEKNGRIAEECKVMVTCTTTGMAAKAAGEVRLDGDDEVVLLKNKQPTGSAMANSQTDGGHHTSRLKFVSVAASNDPKPLLKLKFKNPYFEQCTSWASQGAEENPVKGQRSKRKRPLTTEKFDAGAGEEDICATRLPKIPSTDNEREANRILPKLGKDAIGKDVEVHHSSDNSWRKRVVSDVTIRGGSTSSSSSLLVLPDDGRATTLDLRKQAVCFASQEQNKRAKTRY